MHTHVHMITCRHWVICICFTAGWKRFIYGTLLVSCQLLFFHLFVCIFAKVYTCRFCKVNGLTISHSTQVRVNSLLVNDNVFVVVVFTMVYIGTPAYPYQLPLCVYFLSVFVLAASCVCFCRKNNGRQTIWQPGSKINGELVTGSYLYSQ